MTVTSAGHDPWQTGYATVSANINQLAADRYAAGELIMRVITAGAGCALALGLAGCGGSSQASGDPTPTISTCTIYAQGHDARITVAGSNGTSECDKLIQNFSGLGAFWSYQATAPQEGRWGQVCDVFSDGMEAVVYDDGGQDIGQEVCSDFTSAGWTEQQAQGPLAQQLARQLQQQEQAQASAAASQAQAQASASAAASQAQQVANLQSRVSNDISVLASNATGLENNNSLAGAIQTMRNGLGTEESEYATVQNVTCYAGQKGGDADTVTGDSDTVDGDLDTLNGDITTLQNNPVANDLSGVQGDVSQLQQLGASPDSDPTVAIAAGKKALNDLASAIASAQKQGSSLDREAHKISNEAQARAAQCPS